jgi:hypothetical protein
MLTNSGANPLAPHYRAFRVDDPARVLLTGHSHQAWPDVAREGQLEAFEDAARHVDDKWERALAKADELRSRLALLLDDPGAQLALGTSTHELIVRLLSALPLDRRPRLLTSDGEFHTLRRQLARLAEAGLDVVRVPSSPAASLAERLAAEVDDLQALADAQRVRREALVQPREQASADAVALGDVFDFDDRSHHKTRAALK